MKNFGWKTHQNASNVDLYFSEWSDKSSESHGRNLEHHGEKREDHVDQKGSRGPEKIWGQWQLMNSVHQSSTAFVHANFPSSHRETCVRCAHLLLPLPQGRRWSLRVNLRNHHRKFVLSIVSAAFCVCVCFLETFRNVTFTCSWLSLETDIRSSLRRCCPMESWITSRWKSGWLRSAAAGRGYHWRRRTATRRSLRRSRDSTKCSWSSGSL